MPRAEAVHHIRSPDGKSYKLRGNAALQQRIPDKTQAGPAETEGRGQAARVTTRSSKSGVPNPQSFTGWPPNFPLLLFNGETFRIGYKFELQSPRSQEVYPGQTR